MEVDADIRWVPAENLHLTLKFLGEITVSDLKPLSELLQRDISGFGSLGLRLEGLGRFPEKGRMRVVWVGCQGDLSRLTSLAQRVERAALQIDVPRDSRPFSPHLTIGRVRSAHNQDALLQVINERGAVYGSLEVDTICLYQSTLTPAGPRYDILKKFPLI